MVGGDVGDRVDGDGDIGGLGRPVVGHRIGEHGVAVVVVFGREGERIVGAQRDRAVADRDRGAAFDNRRAVDGGDLRAVLEIVRARVLAGAAHRVEGDRGVFIGGDMVGGDVGDRVDGDADRGWSRIRIAGHIHHGVLERRGAVVVGVRLEVERVARIWRANCRQGRRAWICVQHAVRGRARHCKERDAASAGVCT